MARDLAKLRRWLEEAARAEGFVSVHVTRAELAGDVAANLSAFLAAGRQGDMEWLAETAARRAQPTAMWPGARSALVLTMNYGPDHDPMDNLAARSHGNVSVYARGRDYHDVIKGRLKQLASQFAARAGADVKVFVWAPSSPMLTCRRMLRRRIIAAAAPAVWTSVRPTPFQPPISWMRGAAFPI